MTLSQVEKRKEWAIQKAVSMKTLLMSPMYDELEALYVAWKAEPHKPTKDGLWDDMELILNDYGFRDLKNKNANEYGVDQIEFVLDHLFVLPGGGGPSRGW